MVELCPFSSLAAGRAATLGDCEHVSIGSSIYRLKTQARSHLAGTSLDGLRAAGEPRAGASAHLPAQGARSRSTPLALGWFGRPRRCDQLSACGVR